GWPRSRIVCRDATSTGAIPRTGTSVARVSSLSWCLSIAGAAAVVYYPTFVWLADSWINDRFYSHGFLVAAISIWLAVQQWPQARAAELKPSRWGIPLIAAGLLLEMAGAVSDGMTLSGISLVCVTAGMILASR